MARNPTAFNRGQTIVDPNRVRELDEDNLLGVGGFEDAPPLQVGPNPIQRFADYAGLEVSPDLTAVATPTPEAAPAGEGTGSYIEDAQKAAAPEQATKTPMFSSHFTMKQWDDVNAEEKAANELLASDGGVNASKLVNAAPSWYEGGKPPPGHNTWAAASQALGGALAAPHLQSLKDPLRPAGLKQGDARSAATAQGLSTILSSLFTSGTDKYKANQDAALKEAQMMRTLPGGKSAGQLRSDIAKDRRSAMQRDLEGDSLRGKREFDQSIEKAKHDPNDPEVKGWIETLVRAGRATPDELAGLTKEGIHTLVNSINQRNSAEAVARNEEARGINNERKSALDQGYKTQADYDKEQQEENRRRDASHIPGLESNGAPPDPATVRELRDTHAKASTFIKRLDRMAEIQRRLNERGKGWLGPVNEWFGDPEVKALQGEAARLQDAIGYAIRSADYGNFGVPQKWESLKVAAAAPQAGTPTGYMRGLESWEGISKDVKRMYADHVHAANYHFPGEEGYGVAVQGDRPRPATPTVPARAVVRGGNVERVDDAPVPLRDPDTVPTIPGATPPPPEDQARIDGARAKAATQPAPAPTKAPPPGTKHYTITAGNKTSEADFTPEEYEKFVNAQRERIASGKLKIVGG